MRQGRSGTPYLPKPAGAHPVGTTSLHLSDASRPDPWVPAARTRELMVSLWYPTAARMGAPSDDGTWKRDWGHLTGWKRWLVVKGALQVTPGPAGP
ncbi:hypothetical protein [Nonomuraea sp. NPDC050691]|uniref:hypothetical protein n=1 Tax=Nonomuraea sp. NPDC050691 TaxID=3155661 RepID=UPI0033E334FC